MTTFYVRAQDRQQVRQLRATKGQAQPLAVDFSPIADDIGALTGATWTVKSGNAAISGTALSSNVASAVITTADMGDSMIEVKGANATYAEPIRIRVFAKDPDVLHAWDYGIHG